MANVFNFTVLKETPKGMFVTDGNKIAWVQNRARRANGTFGSGAVRALQASPISGSTLEDYKKYTNEVLTVVSWWGPEFKTEKAILVNGQWLPLSLTSFRKNDSGKFEYSAPRWILQKAYLI